MDSFFLKAAKFSNQIKESKTCENSKFQFNINHKNRKKDLIKKQLKY